MNYKSAYSWLDISCNGFETLSTYFYNGYIINDCTKVIKKLTELTVAEGSLFTVLLTVTAASGTEMQYMSLLNLTEFRYTPAATAVSLSSSKIKVSYEP